MCMSMRCLCPLRCINGYQRFVREISRSSEEGRGEITLDEVESQLGRKQYLISIKIGTLQQHMSLMACVRAETDLPDNTYTSE